MGTHSLIEDLWLDPIPHELREWAVESIGTGDVFGFLIKANNESGIDLIYKNRFFLSERGLLECGLLHAITATRTNNHQHYNQIYQLLNLADRTRLRAVGHALPGERSFRLFRGVAGMGVNRRIRGLSWTTSITRAAWFANRYSGSLANPAVYAIKVPAKMVLAYSNDRQEEEFIVLLPSGCKPRIAVRGQKLVEMARSVNNSPLKGS